MTRPPTLPASNRLAGHKARLEEAARLVRSVRDDLDTSSQSCECCGLDKAVNWGESLAAESLGGVIRRLERCAEEAYRGYPSKRKTDHVSEESQG